MANTLNGKRISITLVITYNHKHNKNYFCSMRFKGTVIIYQLGGGGGGVGGIFLMFVFSDVTPLLIFIFSF